MPVRLVHAFERGAYMTDGKRLLRVLSLTGKEVLCKDSKTFEVEGFPMTELAKPRWRRVWQEDAEK